VAFVGCTTTFTVAQDPTTPFFPAAVYEARSDALEETVATTTLAEALPGVEWSACLALAAEKVLTDSIGSPDPRLREGRLHAITRTAGCPDPLPTLLVVDTSEASTVDIGAELRRARRDHDGPVTRAGIARGRIDRGRFRWRWVAILSARPAELVAAVPRALEPGSVVPLRVRLADGLDAPSAVVAPPDGRLHRLALAARGGVWWTLIHAGTVEGALTLQLFAESATGDRLVAVLDLWVGPYPPDRAFAESTTPTDRRTFGTLDDAKHWMLSRVNELRREIGAQELVSDALLDRVATAHSEDMRRSGFVGHRSPTTGELPDRLAAAGIDYRSARENVAWSGGVESAMHQLEHSPAHRANLLAPDLDRVGIGLVATPGSGDPAREWLVTQVFVGSLSRVTIDEMRTAATTGVDALRGRRGVAPIIRCPELDAAASALADEPHALVQNVDTSFVRLRDALGDGSDRWGELQLAVVRANQPRDIRLPEIFAWHRAEAWGVAVNHVPQDDLPPFQVVWVISADIPWRRCD
jgi:uncharacterized protein YkwD